MTDAEKIRIYEENFNIEAMKKINAVISKGNDVEIQHRKNQLVIKARKSSEIVRIEK